VNCLSKHNVYTFLLKINLEWEDSHVQNSALDKNSWLNLMWLVIAYVCDWLHFSTLQKHIVNLNIWRFQEHKHQMILDQQLWAAIPSKSYQKQKHVWVRKMLNV